MLDNLQVAILTKVNELAERHGIRPYEFCAVVRTSDDASNLTLHFEVPVSENSPNAKDFDKMLTAIGFEDAHSFTGSDKRIVDALDNALRRAPLQRPRS